MEKAGMGRALPPVPWASGGKRGRHNAVRNNLSFIKIKGAVQIFIQWAISFNDRMVESWFDVLAGSHIVPWRPLEWRSRKEVHADWGGLPWASLEGWTGLQGPWGKRREAEKRLLWLAWRPG